MLSEETKTFKSRDTYSTPMTFLMMDWNSSSVYSRVGKGAILILEGVNCVHGTLREEGTPKVFAGGSSTFPVSDCCEAKIIKESSVCWSCSNMKT